MSVPKHGSVLKSLSNSLFQLLHSVVGFFLIARVLYTPATALPPPLDKMS